MSDYYFKFKEDGFLYGLNSRFENYPPVNYYKDNYDTDFSIWDIRTLRHDVLDHTNGQQYIGVIADEIMAITSYYTTNYKSELLEEILYQLEMFNHYNNDWGRLPKGLENKLIDPIPKGKYFKMFEEYFPELSDLDSLFQSINNYELCNLNIRQCSYVQKLIYHSMVQTLKKYHLSSPKTKAPIMEAYEYLLGNGTTISDLRIFNYMRFSVKNYSIQLSHKEHPSDAWYLYEEVYFHQD